PARRPPFRSSRPERNPLRAHFFTVANPLRPYFSRPANIHDYCLTYLASWSTPSIPTTEVFARSAGRLPARGAGPRESHAGGNVPCPVSRIAFVPIPVGTQ